MSQSTQVLPLGTPILCALLIIYRKLQILFAISKRFYKKHKWQKRQELHLHYSKASKLVTWKKHRKKEWHWSCSKEPTEKLAPSPLARSVRNFNYTKQTNLVSETPKAQKTWQNLKSYSPSNTFWNRDSIICAC